MFRKAFAALAALSLAAQPALAEAQKPKDKETSSILTHETILPAAIILVLILLVFGYTLQTKGSDKPASP